MKVINKSYRFRIYPDNAQKEFLEKHFGCVRFAYNYFLNQRKEQYLATGKSDSYYAQQATLTQLKKQEQFAWLNEVFSQSLQCSLRNLERAYTNFFQKRARFPHFHSKKNTESFTIPQFWKIKDRKLYLPKFKTGIKIQLCREIKGKMGQVVITKMPSGKYFASITSTEEYQELPATNNAVGLDCGLRRLIITSNGKVFENNKFTKKYRKKLAAQQRHLSRKHKGSNGFESQRLKVARVYEKIANCRTDYLQKCSTEIIRNNDIICVEDLNIKGMMKNHHLAEAIADAGWSDFIRMLSYKADWNNRKLIKIDRFFPSSQTCCVCGYINEGTKDLSVHLWKCPHCGTIHDRDINAARNILKMGLNTLSSGSGDYTGGGNVRVCSEFQDKPISCEAGSQ